jgi:hypothetical protein
MRNKPAVSYMQSLPNTLSGRNEERNTPLLVTGSAETPAELRNHTTTLHLAAAAAAYSTQLVFWLDSCSGDCTAYRWLTNPANWHSTYC